MWLLSSWMCLLSSNLNKVTFEGLSFDLHYVGSQGPLADQSKHRYANNVNKSTHCHQAVGTSLILVYHVYEYLDQDSMVVKLSVYKVQK